MSKNTLINIDTSFESYEKLITFYHNNKKCFLENVEINLSTWFAANLSSVFGAILDKIDTSLITIKINGDDSIIRILQKNNFLSYFGYDKINDTYNTTIKYLKLKPTDGRFFQEYVFEDLLSRSSFPNISLALKKKITESIYEIFVNAQLHSHTDFIYTCGQFYPNKNKIEFTIADTGLGFKNVIGNYFQREISAKQAIQWALNDGNTTKKEISGGIGLAILKEFVTLNKGKIQIISNDGYYQLDSSGEVLKQFHLPFPGTIVNMQFKTDDTNSYTIKDNGDDIF